MNRRGFLHAMLAAGMAPAIVKAANIMPVFARRESGLLVPEAFEQFVITEITQGDMLITPAMVARESIRILHEDADIVRKIGGDFATQFRVGDLITFGDRRK